MVKSNRFQALAFIVLTFLVSWVEQYYIVRGDGIQNPTRSFCLMWTPGVVGIFCYLFFDRNLKAIAFRLPTLKTLGIGYFVPAITAVTMVALLIATTVAQFQVSPQLIEKKGSLSSALIAALVVAPTLGMILAFLSGLGEELGWRGFLHSKLLNIAPAKRYLVIGVIWSLWHWPLILFGDYATSDKPWLNVVLFTVAVVSFSFLMGWLRDTSRSSIPEALAHASHNMWVLGVAPVFFKPGPLVPYFGGESGVFCALIYLVLAFFIFQRLKKSSIYLMAEASASASPSFKNKMASGDHPEAILSYSKNPLTNSGPAMWQVSGRQFAYWANWWIRTWVLLTPMNLNG